MIGEEIRKKFEELINEGNKLKQGKENGRGIFSEEHKQKCVGWLASAQNIVHLVTKNPLNPYRASIDKICDENVGWLANCLVGDANEILKSLLKDVNSGLITSIEDQTKAVIFDNFLDHAKFYVKGNRKNESGVIAGVVFEDTIRTICRNVGIEEKNEKLDNLISGLVKNETITEIKAKRARAVASVRTSATHARWEEFELDDVKTTIEFTEELIQKYLEK